MLRISTFKHTQNFFPHSCIHDEIGKSILKFLFLEGVLDHLTLQKFGKKQNFLVTWYYTFQNQKIKIILVRSVTAKLSMVLEEVISALFTRACEGRRSRSDSGAWHLTHEETCGSRLLPESSDLLVSGAGRIGFCWPGALSLQRLLGGN